MHLGCQKFGASSAFIKILLTPETHFSISLNSNLPDLFFPCRAMNKDTFEMITSLNFVLQPMCTCAQLGAYQSKEHAKL